MTYTIGICDDDCQIFDIVKNIIKENLYNVEFYDYTNSADVIEHILMKKEPLDILILDIDMPNFSGFDLAKKLRDSGEELIIIFLTAHEQFVFAAYEYTPFRYIRKNCMNDELPIAVKSALKAISKKLDTGIVLKSEDGEYKIFLADIIYYEFTGRKTRKIIIHLKNGTELAIRKTIKEMSEIITEPYFITLHRSCVVNANYIKNIHDGIVHLDNGEGLPISRGHIKEARRVLAGICGDLI